MNKVKIPKILTNSLIYMSTQIILYFFLLYLQINYTNKHVIMFGLSVIYLLLVLRYKFLNFSGLFQFTLFLLCLTSIFTDVFLSFLLKFKLFQEGLGLNFVLLYENIVSIILFIFIIWSFVVRVKSRV